MATTSTTITTSGHPNPQPITTVLIANRGEIAVRIIRSCRDLGIRTVGVASEADLLQRHARMVDHLVPLSGSTARESYLSIDQIVNAAVDSGADAVHPGYGFLAERAEFAEAVAAAGLRFVGPPPHVMRALGDKRAARDLAASAELPVLPGALLDGVDDASRAASVGYPLMIKAAHGGGGRGIRIVEDADTLGDSIRRARDESRLAFGRDDVFAERFVRRPRHVEVQILCDGYGAVVHLGTRDCSTQRRHQKLIEEAPASSIDENLRSAVADAACRLARHAGYVGAGTVEFLVDQETHEFWFLEVNARLQVEHTVTEMITGIDIVRNQLQITAGLPLPFDQRAVSFDGHAIQVRINAEDPVNDFMPSLGKISRLALPHGPWIRCDSGVDQGDTIGPFYDSLIAKAIAWGPTREDAIARLSRALDETHVVGVATTTAYLRTMLDHAIFRAGEVWTGFVDTAPIETTAGGDRFTFNDITHDGECATQAPIVERQITIASTRGVIDLYIPVAGGSADVEQIQATSGLGERAGHTRATSASDAAAPMDGVLTSFTVSVGDAVEPNTTIAIVESMKLETEVRAGRAGVVRALRAAVGDAVRRGHALVEIESAP
jgi:acetyl-CoA/propionyl-CoA carboxylase biotin carboxyl carrier protein